MIYSQQGQIAHRSKGSTLDVFKIATNNAPKNEIYQYISLVKN